jgi:hypothetical protein
MKMSELPAGTIVEIAYGKEYAERYERKNSAWKSIERDMATIELDAMDEREDVQIVALPVEVAYKLAEWLDNVYTKHGNPDSLVLEAIKESQKDKHDSYIAAYPEKKADVVCKNCGDPVTISRTGVFHTMSFMVRCGGSRETRAEYDVEEQNRDD